MKWGLTELGPAVPRTWPPSWAVCAARTRRQAQARGQEVRDQAPTSRWTSLAEKPTQRTERTSPSARHASPREVEKPAEKPPSEDGVTSRSGCGRPHYPSGTYLETTTLSHGFSLPWRSPRFPPDSLGPPPPPEPPAACSHTEPRWHALDAPQALPGAFLLPADGSRLVPDPRCFTAIPYIQVNGKPLMLLDIANRPVHLLREDLPVHRHVAAHALPGQRDHCHGSSC